MKISGSYKTLFIVLIMFFANHIMAQASNKNSVPAAITAALSAKYPAAALKHWKIVDGKYIATAVTGGRTLSIAFNQDGNWISTTSKISWPWRLPVAVKTALNQSDYKSWNLYNVKMLEKPSGEFYLLTVDDRNRPADIYHQGKVTEQRIVEIKADGKLIDEVDADEKVSL